MTPTSRTQTYESFMTFATEALAWVAKQPKFKLKPDLKTKPIEKSIQLDPKIVAQNTERACAELEHLEQVLAWAKKQPKFKVKPDLKPKNIVETYEANNLLYIRYEAKIVPKPGGKQKIQGHLPPHGSLTKQPDYSKYSPYSVSYTHLTLPTIYSV